MLIRYGIENGATSVALGLALAVTASETRPVRASGPNGRDEGQSVSVLEALCKKCSSSKHGRATRTLGTGASAPEPK